MDEKWMKVFLMVVAVFTKLWECAAITNNGQRNFRHIPPASSTSDQLLEWELGLREAVTQVLQRHHYTPDLRLRVLSAPMMHRQKAATPFGDISTLAKGRLYATPGGGFEFVQENEDRNCGPCARCNRVMCEDIYSGDPTHLLALWTVKRLRHRTHHGGFNYETEYTVSPIDDITKAIRDGRFDYSLPGHVFVINKKEATGSTFPETYNSKIPTDLFKPDVIIGIDNYGNRHILKTYHPFFTSPTQQQPVITPPQNQEIELYKILLKTLASKTSTTPSEEGPFRVSLNHYIPPPLPSSPTISGAEIKPPTQADNVGDVTQPVKTTVHYFMQVGEELMTTKEIGGSTPTPKTVTEKAKATKKPSLLTSKTKTPVIVTSKRPTIGLVHAEGSEEESEELFPEPAGSGSSTIKNITKPTNSGITQKDTSTAKIPTTKFIIQTESEEGSETELFPEPVEATKPTVASTTKLTTKAATKQTTKRQKLTTTRGITKQVVLPTEPEISSTKLTSSTNLHTTAAMKPRTTPSMTAIESSTAIVAPSEATTSTKRTIPKRKRPNYVSTITRVQKPTTRIPTTISTIAQPNTIKMQTSPKPTKPKPTIQSTTEVKTLTSTAVLPEPSTESTRMQTVATSIPTTSQTIPGTLSTTMNASSYPTQPGPIRTSFVPTTFKLAQSEMVPEVLSTLPMTATTQKIDVTAPNQMQIPVELGTTSPYQTTTQSSSRTEADHDRETTATDTTSGTYNESTTENNEATKIGTTFYSTSEIARETTKIGTTTQMTEKAESTTIPSTTETVYTLQTTSAFDKTTTILSSTESERTIPALKETMATVKTTEAATGETTTEILTQVSTQNTTPAKNTVTRISSATETTETTAMEKVTVTPIYIEMTTPIISTETSTTPASVTVKHTTVDTFLIDRKPTKPTSKRPVADVNEDDIFGVPLATVRPPTTTTKPPMKPLPKGFEELFDNLQSPQNAKIIFSDFYEASTSPAPTQSTAEMNQLLTSQSYETSISFKVNKRDRTQFQPSTANPTSTFPQNPDRLFHQQALQLANHARSIEYLNQDDGDKTVRSSKYKRRRGYVSRTKKLVSKRKRISRDRYENSQS